MRSGQPGEALLQHMQRLLARAAAVPSTDRRQLLALLDELETTRSGLLQACAQIEDEMRRAALRATAIGAYVRGSQAGRGRRQN